MTDLLSLPGTLWLDTARAGEYNPNGLLFSHPRRVIEAHTVHDVVAALNELDRAVAAGRYVAGYVAYEAAGAFLPVPPCRQPAAPLVWFGVYDAPVMLAAERAAALAKERYTSSARLYDLRFTEAPDAYIKNVEAIRRHIREGDVYQINFTGDVEFEYSGPEAALYGMLRQRQRVAYGAYLNTGNQHVLSFSPELFFRQEGEVIRVRPMKGTTRRGSSPEEDDRLAEQLASDEKNRAENLMIVDLLRNDLSVVCRPGTVRVPHLFTTERYETLTQMTSTVEGRLVPGTTYTEIFRALFPCGSVTGAPKIRAMQLIHGLEQRPRGIYCGAIGYVAPEGKAVFNVAIRTLVLADGRGSMGVGSGIVWDSDPEAEYSECLLKARFLDPSAAGRLLTGMSPRGEHRAESGQGALLQSPASKIQNSTRRSNFELIETMRWEGHFPLLDLHLARLRISAGFFGFPFDEAIVRSALSEATSGLSAEASHRVRMTLDAAGRVVVMVQVLPPDYGNVRSVVLSKQHVDSGNVLFYHKTTRRDFFEAEYQRACRVGVDEVVFLNERGEVTEGSRSNVFVRQGDALYTPPVSSGLLAGVYRKYLLDTRPGASERVLYPEDLINADALYVCNAVWGLRKVTLRAPVDQDPPAKACI